MSQAAAPKAGKSKSKAPTPVQPKLPKTYTKGGGDELAILLQPILTQILHERPYNILGRPNYPNQAGPRHPSSTTPSPSPTTTPTTSASSAAATTSSISSTEIKEVDQNNNACGSIDSTYCDCVDLAYYTTQLAYDKLFIEGMVVCQYLNDKPVHTAAAFPFKNLKFESDSGYVILDGGCQCTSPMVYRHNCSVTRTRPPNLRGLRYTAATLLGTIPVPTLYQDIIHNQCITTNQMHLRDRINNDLSQLSHTFQNGSKTTTTTTTPTTASPSIATSTSTPTTSTSLSTSPSPSTSASTLAPTTTSSHSSSQSTSSGIEKVYSIVRRNDSFLHPDTDWGYYLMTPLQKPEMVAIRSIVDKYLFIALHPPQNVLNPLSIQLFIAVYFDTKKHNHYVVSYCQQQPNETKQRVAVLPYKQMVTQLDAALGEYGVPDGLTQLLNRLNVHILDEQEQQK